MKYGHVCLLIYLNSPKSPRLTDCTFQTADGLLDPVGLQEGRTSHRHSELLHSVLCWVSTVETPSPGPATLPVSLLNGGPGSTVDTTQLCGATAGSGRGLPHHTHSRSGAVNI